MSAMSSGFEGLNNSLGKFTGGFTMEALFLGLVLLVIIAFAPVVIAIAKGRRDLGPDAFAIGLMGFLACGSGLLMPLGLYFFYANYERALTA